MTGRSIWWSSVPSGSAKGRVISEGFTSSVSDKGLLCTESCSLTAWSSTLQSGFLSVPEWTFVLCFFKFLMSVYEFPHNSQINGRSPVWDRKCLLSSPEEIKLFPQIPHMYGFSPRWKIKDSEVVYYTNIIFINYKKSKLSF